MIKAQYRIEKETDEVMGDCHGLFIRNKLIASTDRVDGGYCVRWYSRKTLSELAEALRTFYAGLRMDIVDKSEQKIFTNPGMYIIFNGSISGGIKVVVRDTEQDLGEVQVPKALASLDDFITNTEPVAAFFKRGYQNNLGSVRVVTPYCDMFLEQYGRPLKLIAVMADDQVNLAGPLASPIRATTNFQRYANTSYFPSALADLVERVITPQSIGENSKELRDF